MECSVCGGKVEEIHKASGICESCANLLGEMGPSGLEALNRQQKRYNALKDVVAEKDRLIEKLKAVNHRQAEDISGLDLAYKSASEDRELMRGEIAGLRNVDLPAFQSQLAKTNLQKSELEKLCRWVIENRFCVCNRAGHPCGTNNMLDNLNKILGIKEGDYSAQVAFTEERISRETRWCTCVPEKDGTHQSDCVGEETKPEKRKCAVGCMDRHFCNAPKLHEGGCHCKLEE